MVEFWRATLNSRYAAIYDDMLQAIKRRSASVPVPQISEPSDLTLVILAAIMHDHPELYYVSPQMGVSTSSGPMVTSMFGMFRQQPQQPSMQVQISYLYSQSETVAIERSFSAFKNDISRLKGKSELEIELEIVKRIVQNTEYQINNLMNQNAMSSIHYKRAQCSGFASAFKLAMDLMNIWCITVSGEATDNNNGGGPHAWNIIRIDGCYYHIDPTMMKGANSTPGMPLRYWRVNCSDQTMKAAGYKWRSDQTPPCTQDMDMTPYNPQPRTQTSSGTRMQYGASGMNGYQSQAGGARPQTSAPLQPCDKTIERLYDLGIYIRECLSARKASFTIEMNIPHYTQEKLQNTLMNTVREKATSMNMGMSYRVSSTGNRFTVDIEYQ